MAISSQRLIIMTIIINIILMLTLMFYAQSSLGFENEIDKFSDNTENFTKSINDQFDEQNLDTNTFKFDEGYGNIRFAWKAFSSIFFGGINNPIEQTCNDYRCSDVERVFLNGLTWTIRVINLILVFELILLIYSKKNT